MTGHVSEHCYQCHVWLHITCTAAESHAWRPPTLYVRQYSVVGGVSSTIWQEGLYWEAGTAGWGGEQSAGQGQNPGCGG